QGFIAGLFDAMGGGGWGPVNTPILLSSKKLEPRYVIGTVSASEFFVTLSASISFIIFLGFGNINWGTVIALALGGVLSAPIAAYLVKI
ncbi:sulfite exporter TauE/SafE family protein, partial [Pseudomonas aeruginosa]